MACARNHRHDFDDAACGVRMQFFLTDIALAYKKPIARCTVGQYIISEAGQLHGKRLHRLQRACYLTAEALPEAATYVAEEPDITHSPCSDAASNGSCIFANSRRRSIALTNVLGNAGGYGRRLDKKRCGSRQRQRLASARHHAVVKRAAGLR